MDCEIKHNHIKQVRNLFERCITLKLKPKKIQFFFKRYLEFEINQGDETKVNQVKTKAQAYVQTLINEASSEEASSDWFFYNIIQSFPIYQLSYSIPT